MRQALEALAALAIPIDPTGLDLSITLREYSLTGIFVELIDNVLHLLIPQVVDPDGTVITFAEIYISICDITTVTLDEDTNPLIIEAFATQYPTIFISLFPNTTLPTSCPNCADTLRTILINNYTTGQEINIITSFETVETFERRTADEIKQGIALFTAEGQPILVSLCDVLGVATPLPVPV